MTSSSIDLPQSLIDAMHHASYEGTLTVAYSGGLDSRFLAFAAQRAGLQVQLLHVTGPHIAPEETQEALDRATRMGLAVQCITINPLNVQALAQAGRNRCYVCKTAVFTELLKHAVGEKLCDGTNASDRLVYRPGKKALDELGIYSPLAQAGLTKANIRELGRALGFENPEQVARPCLLTRFPYGSMPSAETLQLVAEAEQWISKHITGKRLHFRLRFPLAHTPELHIERASLKGIDSCAIEALVEDLKSVYPALSRLRWVPFETLSGYYDRENPT